MPTWKPSSLGVVHDLRLGDFDMIVGIDLLREGLDMPEVPG